MRNMLYYGDNLDVLRRHVDNETVDLVYLDPPFNSNQNYNILFAEKDGSQAAAQIKAFEDTWHWDSAAASAYHETVEGGGKVSKVLQAFRTFIGENDMLAYLSMMAPRLVKLHQILKPSGSIYLHCDPTASHYLKLLMDAVFGPENFLNEIIWRRTGSHNSPKRYGPIHDVILFYSKTDEYYFTPTYRPYMQGHVAAYFKQQDDRGKFWTNALTGAGTRNGESGSPWRTYEPTPAGRHWAVPGKIAEELGLDKGMSLQKKLDAMDAAGFICHPAAGAKSLPTYRQYLKDSKGMPLQDIWAYQPYTKGMLYESDEAIDEDVRWLVKQGDSERLGYPTQKTVGLLSRIIRSSCPPGGTVLDPFCGCGTTIDSAQELGRRWIGIDITHLAIHLIRRRLRERYGVDILKTFKVIGEPTSVEDAKNLAETDPFQFEWWSTGLVGAMRVDGKKGADKGVDGRLYFHDDPKGGDTKQVIISVKAGKLHAPYVRDLRGTMEREKAQIGVLIAMEEPTKLMKSEAASAGFYESPLGKKHQRLQILTIAELLSGKGIDYPTESQKIDRTFRKAVKATKGETPSLF